MTVPAAVGTRLEESVRAAAAQAGSFVKRVTASAAAEFVYDEDAHPRGPDGRYESTGGDPHDAAIEALKQYAASTVTLHARLSSNRVEFYNEDQPRDADGRWGGGDSSKASAGPAWRAALEPARQWSEQGRQAAIDALTAAPNGKILADTLDRFQDGGRIGLLRSNVDRYLAGDEHLNPTAADRAHALVDALRETPPADRELYRGIAVKGTADNIVAKYQGMGHVDMNVSSFTSDRGMANKFSKMEGNNRGNTRVIVKVEPGARALPIQNLARDRRLFPEKEWVGAGRFDITDVKKGPDGAVLVSVRQAATL